MCTRLRALPIEHKLTNTRWHNSMNSDNGEISHLTLTRFPCQSMMCSSLSDAAWKYKHGPMEIRTIEILNIPIPLGSKFRRMPCEADTNVRLRDVSLYYAHTKHQLTLASISTSQSTGVRIWYILPLRHPIILSGFSYHNIYLNKSPHVSRLSTILFLIKIERSIMWTTACHNYPASVRHY